MNLLAQTFKTNFIIFILYLLASDGSLLYIVSSLIALYDTAIIRYCASISTRRANAEGGELRRGEQDKRQNHLNSTIIFPLQMFDGAVTVMHTGSHVTIEVSYIESLLL